MSACGTERKGKGVGGLWWGVGVRRSSSSRSGFSRVPSCLIHLCSPCLGRGGLVVAMVTGWGVWPSYDLVIRRGLCRAPFGLGGLGEGGTLGVACWKGVWSVSIAKY